MEEKSYNFLKALINSSSPSGFEGPASNIWREYVGERLSITTDIYGGSYAHVFGKTAPFIMLSGHIDEVGFMVNYISDSGFIYVYSIGGVDCSVATAKQVIIHSKNGPVKGIFGRTAIHILDKDDEGPKKIHQMFIDIGAKDKEDAMKLVSVGDPVTFDVKFEEYPNNCIVGRGLDDRIGAWCVAETLLRLNDRREELNACVYGVATIQEENGIYGATIGVEQVRPTVALAIDVTHATDTPGISKEKCGEVNLGEGPSINIGSTSHPKVNQMLIDIAEKNKIPLQKEASPRWSGTDADAIFKARGGIACANLSIPNRYMHSPVEMISLEDLENTVKLMVEFCLECKEEIKFK